MSLVPKLIQQIDERIAELRPHVDELQHLERIRERLIADAATAGSAPMPTPVDAPPVPADAQPAPPADAQPAPEPPKSDARPRRAAAASRPRRARAKKSLQDKAAISRSDEALRLVSERPGITAAELSEATDINITYLYRVLPQLQRDGKIRKSGKGYHPSD